MSTPAAATSDAAPSSSPERHPGALLLGLALAAMLLMWSFNYVAGKIALRTLDPLALASFRMVTAALVILPLYFAQRERQPLVPRTLVELRYIFFLGLAMAVNQCLFTIGLAFTSSGHSSVILACGPVLVLLLAWMMKQEARTTGKILGTALAFGGVLVLESERGLFAKSPFLTGDLITLAGTTSFAFYVVFGKRIAREYSSITMNTLNLLVCGALLLPVAVWRGIALDWKSVGWPGWLGMLYMAVFSSVAAYVLFYWALRHMTASRVAAVNYFQPVGAIAFAALFLGESPTASLVAGAALVVLGVWLAEQGKG